MNKKTIIIIAGVVLGLIILAGIGATVAGKFMWGKFKEETAKMEIFANEFMECTPELFQNAECTASVSEDFLKVTEPKDFKKLSTTIHSTLGSRSPGSIELSSIQYKTTSGSDFHPSKSVEFVMRTSYENDPNTVEWFRLVDWDGQGWKLEGFSVSSDRFAE